MKIILILLLTTIEYSQGRIPLLFERPRDGKFKFVDNDVYNSTTLAHATGSFMLTTLVAAAYKAYEVSEQPALWGAATVWGLGFLKEAEDGFREGFSGQDLLSNTIGTVVGGGLFAILNYYHLKRVKAGIVYNRVYLSVEL